jgi:poly-gamma-glutamate capsule biosynthesis protein CapA/YwtB (metallophosphatase superfamily)
VGDIMLGTNFPDASYLPADSARRLLKPVAHILTDADLTIRNLEGALLNAGGTSKKCQDMNKCYAFRMPERFVYRLTEAGFDAVSIANNHCGDFGDTGRINTMKMLDAAGLHYAGLLSCPAVIFEQNGVRYGLCAFSPFTGTQDILLADTAALIVRTLDSLCDIVIVSMHAGAEGAAYRHVTRQTEIFYDEDRGNVYEFAHRMVDAGADIIFGHGPHVTRAVELYNDRLIAYSLGNFCTYARFNLKGSNGVAPILKVYTDRTGKFIQAKVFSISQVGEGGPVLDEANTALYELIELSGADFPETAITITGNGWIKRK